jgi:RNA polymerase sigma factor (sigma-70 family)
MAASRTSVGYAAGESDSDPRFAQLYPELRRFAAVVASSDVDPDDLVQDALAGALRRGPFSEIENPGAYLRQAILNLERSHRRRWARWRARAHQAPQLPAAVEDDHPSDLALLQELEPGDRALLYLSIVEDLPYAVIAELLGGDEASLRARASKARKLLRRLLAKDDRT